MLPPATKVLTLLELLQSRPQWSGEELSRRLRVSPRQLRRYVTALQDLGMPVEAERGRYGGYSLGSGYRLPPLMFNNDEALALTLGLLAAQRLGLTGAAPAVEGTFAKIQRVLPAALKEQIRALEESLVLYFDKSGAAADGALVLTLSLASWEGRRVFMRYRSWQGKVSERDVDPYGVVYYNEAWFVVGYCQLRRALRTFRLDRVLELALRNDTFDRPASFDALAHVEEALARTPGAYTAEIVVFASPEEVREKVPGWLATLEAHPEGVLMRAQVRRPLDLPWLAHFLAGLGWLLVVREPPELREALRALARHADRLAEQRGPYG